MILAIDTSTRNASVAIFNEGSVQAELTWQSAQNHSRELMPNIVAVAGQAKVELADMKSIVIAKGPGSFSALRVGMSVAKGLAFALAIPLIGISTLEAIAYQQIAAGDQICPILGASRGQIAAAIFQRRRGKLDRVLDEQILTVGVLASLISRKTVFCGEIDEELISSLRELTGRNAVFLPPVASYRRAGYVADLGWRRLSTGYEDEVDALQPTYLRHPSVGGRRTKVEKNDEE